MDRSLQQQLYGGVGRNSFASAGSRTRQSSASSLSSASGRKSMHAGSNASPLLSASAYKRNTPGSGSRYSVSGRSNQTLVGIISELNVVESYGFQLPVLVNEALTFSEKNLHVSVKCSPNGWAWVVCGRRLLIWQYKANSSSSSSGSGSPTSRSNNKELPRTPQRRGGVMAQCRELTLPHCDIGHKAKLVSVFLSEGQQMASCVAVSPTGDVRYWPSIAHDGSSVDVTGILDGQEFDFLLNMPEQQGYLLVTTTCSLVFLQLQLVNGRHVLQHRSIKQPSGFLGGFGKKFASIIIGMNSGSDKENKFISVGYEVTVDGEALVTVLADRWVQRWRLANNGSTEQLLYEDLDIVRVLRDEFQYKFWNVRADSSELELHFLDMHVIDKKIYILAGAVNTMHSPQMFYAIVILKATPEAMVLMQLIPLKLSQFYSIGTENDCLSLRFIVCSQHLYLYGDKVIYPLSLSHPAMAEIEAEKIEFQDDRILCAAVCKQMPLFFSRTHGLVCVTPGDFDSTDFLVNVSCSSPMLDMGMDSTLRAMDQSTTAIIENTALEQNLFMYELNPDAIYQEFKDELNQLKAAFIYRIKRNNNMCNTIVNDLLRIENLQLDRLVIAIAEDLAEDIPAADPRWERLWEEVMNNRNPLGSSTSLQIVTQLKEKNIALHHFVEFLQQTGLWQKLNSVPSSGLTLPKPTCHILSDINEKIMGAIALKTAPNKYGKLIDDSINRVVSTWQEKSSGTLTAQDIFYVHICRFQDIFKGFCEVIEVRVESQQQTTTLALLISDIMALVLHVFAEILHARERNAKLYALPADKLQQYEYTPWTALSGSTGVRDELTQLVELGLRYGAQSTSEAELKQKIYQQLLQLVDIILSGRKDYLESVHDTEKYNVVLQQFESVRRNFISMFIEDQQYEVAAKLAEKYLDFQSLVVICDATDNQERLDKYIDKYDEYNFSQFAINWHLRQNRQGEVFERFKGNQAALSTFLRDHPTLGWIQLIFNGDFTRAANILLQLGLEETEYLARKKTILSLAKLSAFAAADADLTAQVECINNELILIEYEEQLDERLLHAFGYDVENLNVLKPEEIINLLISEDHESANESDFRKALELLAYLDDPYELRHKIWCAAIKRDNWLEYDTNNAVEYVQNLLFFRLIELCHILDADFESNLPQMQEILNSPDLSELTQNHKFEYLLKLTYEYVNTTFKQKIEIEVMDETET